MGWCRCPSEQASCAVDPWPGLRTQYLLHDPEPVHPPMFVKICGIRTGEEASAALDCGATALGFLVGLTHRAEDRIGEADARGIVRGLPTGAEAVLVTHFIDPRRVAELAASIGANTIQVHGEMALPDLRRLRALASGGARLLKAVHVVSGEEALGRALDYAADADALVLDTRTADRLGGTGRTHDWLISAQIVAAVAPLPVYLAGGLRPENVVEAIGRVRPAGVDVNSGVEDASGWKDVAKMRAFVACARAGLLGHRGAT
jgi:phosphoribosylanthranilate isomerase